MSRRWGGAKRQSARTSAPKRRKKRARINLPCGNDRLLAAQIRGDAHASRPPTAALSAHRRGKTQTAAHGTAASISGQPHLRCAVYTRKSSEEGLEQDFNSLDAQREACEAYIASQRHESWVLLSDAYDDGGFSGGNMERPALKRLITDVEAGRIDIVVVNKVDRLTRSLSDFARIIEVFDNANGAHKGPPTSFVSVTQSFNTTTSMGRLTLNVLLSFAQFERGDRRTHPRQDPRLQEEGPVNGGPSPWAIGRTSARSASKTPKPAAFE